MTEGFDFLFVVGLFIVCLYIIVQTVTGALELLPGLALSCFLLYGTIRTFLDWRH